MEATDRDAGLSTDIAAINGAEVVMGWGQGRAVGDKRACSDLDMQQAGTDVTARIHSLPVSRRQLEARVNQPSSTLSFYLCSLSLYL